MIEGTLQEEKAILEDEIADLCNRFVECRNHIHIEHIYVNYGDCNKGWFPDWVINIDIEINSTKVIPLAMWESLHLSLEVEEEK